MKRFIIHIMLIYIIPIMTILGYSEIKLRAVPNDYSYKHEWMTNNYSSVRILNLGSSHGYFGIKPEYFSQSAFNLAFSSQSLKYDEFLYNAYATQCDSLSYLIVPVSYFSMRSHLETGIEGWRTKGYCIYMGCDFHQNEPFYNLEIMSKDKLLSIFDVIFDRISFVSCDTLGCGTSYKMEYRNKDWSSTGETACERHTYPNNKKIVGENIEYLQHIIADCQKRDIKVILLTTPTYHTYYEMLELVQLEEMESICNNLDDQYKHVVYLNWLKHDQFNEDDFFDADHLNEFGARKLTKMLDEYMLNWR